MANDTDIAQAINLLKTAFPNYQPDIKATAQLWVSVLGDLPGETLKAAILSCVTEYGRAFAPSVGEIRAAAVKLEAEAQGIPSAQVAYAEVIDMPANRITRRLVIENGQNIIEDRQRNFSHPFVEEVAVLIGWPRSFPTDEPGVDRAQFVRFYDARLQEYMNKVGRLPAIDRYIEERREQSSHFLPGSTTVVKRLSIGRTKE